MASAELLITWCMRMPGDLEPDPVNAGVGMETRAAPFLLPVPDIVRALQWNWQQ